MDRQTMTTPRAATSRLLLPSWVTSVALHAGVFFWLTLQFRGGMASLPGPGDGGLRPVGIYMQSSADGAGIGAQSRPRPLRETRIDTTTAPQTPPTIVETAVWQAAPPTDVAASVQPVVSPTTLESNSVPDAVETGGPEAVAAVKTGDGDGTGDAGEGGTSVGEGGGENGGPNGPGEFFGLRDDGSRYVYVLDRSESMGFHHALETAKAELNASLSGLATAQSFQVIFYSDKPVRMPLSGGVREPMIRATTQNRAKARQFVAGIQPAQSTEHMPALQMALQMKPDAMFFLTDADFPELTPRELQEVRKLNGGRTRIHCVEFGRGADLARAGNFLKTLARENGGTYRYCDITKFTPAAAR